MKKKSHFFDQKFFFGANENIFYAKLQKSLFWQKIKKSLFAKILPKKCWPNILEKQVRGKNAGTKFDEKFEKFERHF